MTSTYIRCMKQQVKSYQEDFRVGSELDSLIQNFEETPFGGISDDTTTERADCTAALAVGKELLAQRGVLLSTACLS